jgi:hypothetical protein
MVVPTSLTGIWETPPRILITKLTDTPQGMGIYQTIPEGIGLTHNAVGRAHSYRNLGERATDCRILQRGHRG